MPSELVVLGHVAELTPGGTPPEEAGSVEGGMQGSPLECLLRKEEEEALPFPEGRGEGPGDGQAGRPDSETGVAPMEADLGREGKASLLRQVCKASRFRGPARRPPPTCSQAHAAGACSPGWGNRRLAVRHRALANFHLPRGSARNKACPPTPYLKPSGLLTTLPAHSLSAGCPSSRDPHLETGLPRPAALAQGHTQT